MTTNRVHIGTKFFKYTKDSDSPYIIRITGINRRGEEESFKYIDQDKNRGTIESSLLFDEYKMLRPDAFIMFSIVEVNGIDDVMVMMQPIDAPDYIPYAVCRQNVTDIFSSMSNPNKVIVGLSISKDTCPVDIDFKEFLAYDKLKYSLTVISYIDDSLSEILSLFGHKRFNTVLKALCTASKDLENPPYGFCPTLRELLKNNNFMYDFRKCFKIEYIPYKLDKEMRHLPEQYVFILEKMLNVKIEKTYMIKYTKEINLKEIKRKYVLISDAVDDLYIVGFDEVDNN